jgi:hypothetical protein
MKAVNLILLLVCFLGVFKQIYCNLADKKEQIQKILDTRNPYCIVYRDAVNAYIRELAPDRICQLKCHNLDDVYAENFPNWYIPNNLPVEKKDCGKIVDDCTYKYDASWMYGNIFYAKMLDADTFLSVILRRYLFCQE